MTRSNTPQSDRYLVIGTSDGHTSEMEEHAELKEARDAAERIAAATGNPARVYQFNSSVELRMMPQWQEAKRGD